VGCDWSGHCRFACRPDALDLIAERTMSTEPDDRIHCGMCRQADGMYCRAAQSGILHGTSRMASPMPVSVLWRCEGFEPHKNLPDQRTGAQRWPGLGRSTKTEKRR
jgi:hypothetical protein